MSAVTRNPATSILLLLDVLFFGVAVWLSCWHGTPEVVQDKVWEAFAGVNGALLLILKADPIHPTPPADPAKPKE